MPACFQVTKNDLVLTRWSPPLLTIYLLYLCDSANILNHPSPKNVIQRPRLRIVSLPLVPTPSTHLYPNSCASSPGNKPVYEQAATSVGQALAANGNQCVYGGGVRGLMGKPIPHLPPYHHTESNPRHRLGIMPRSRRTSPRHHPRSIDRSCSRDRRQGSEIRVPDACF